MINKKVKERREDTAGNLDYRLLQYCTPERLKEVAELREQTKWQRKRGWG